MNDIMKNIIYRIIENEFNYVLDEFYSKKLYLTCLEIKHFFRKGVIYGIRLQTLKEI